MNVAFLAGLVFSPIVAFCTIRATRPASESFWSVVGATATTGGTILVVPFLMAYFFVDDSGYDSPPRDLLWMIIAPGLVIFGFGLLLRLGCRYASHDRAPQATHEQDHPTRRAQ